jgi:3'-phosphoadenosine 5'-phosphosulfate sulfotransferase (PAPS reductase)/FAD synthetase
MQRVLITWVGRTDLRAPAESETVGLGPVAQALDARAFDEVVLLTDYPEQETEPFVRWLESRTDVPIQVAHEPLSGPTAFGEIYQAAVKRCTEQVSDRRKETKLTFHLSPGTPAMAAVWILLAKTRFPR